MKYKINQKCSNCETEFLLTTEFFRCKKGKYWSKCCKKCEAQKQKIWIKNNPEKLKIYCRKTKLIQDYNMTIFQYNDLLKLQNNKCAICGIDSNNLKILMGVDHNHKTGEIRGLLCHSCNVGLGFFKENVELLAKAIEYLMEEKEER